MKFTLTIEADCFSEIAAQFNEGAKQVSPVNVALPGLSLPDKAVDAAKYLHPIDEAPRPDTAKEVEPEAEAPKRTRGKKTDAAKQDTAPSTSGSETPAPASQDTAETGPSASQPEATASPSSVTLDDIRAAASKVMDSGKASGADIQKLLVEKFDGARAFGALKPEQYADVLGELENL